MPDPVVDPADAVDRPAGVETDVWLPRVLRALEATDDAVLMFDVRTLRYMYANQGASRLLGYSNAELLTMTPLHFLPESTEAEYRSRFAGVLHGAETSDTIQAATQRPDGTDVVVEATYRFDGHQWMIVVCRDVTDRLATEAALRTAEQVSAIATERERIAVDLQDNVVQSLFARTCQLAALLPSADDRTRPRITALIEGLAETMDELQTVVFYLHGAASTPGGLRSRLSAEVRTAAVQLGFEPGLQLEGAIDAVEGELVEPLISALRRSLAEIGEHGQTGMIHITISAAHRLAMTVVTDTGDLSPHRPFVARLAQQARAVDGSVTLIRQADGRALLTWTMPRTPTRSSDHLDDAPTTHGPRRFHFARIG